MSIVHDLDMVDIPDDKYISRILELSDHSSMINRLSLVNTLNEVVELIYVELITKCRTTMLTRLYGRYRKLCAARDYEKMFEWRKYHGKRRKRN